MKSLFIAAFFVIIGANCYGQNVDRKLFASLCRGMITQSEYLYIQSRVKKGVSIVVNPVSGKSTIQYQENLDSFAMDFRNRYTKDMQMKILLATPLPYQFLTDTVFIYDSLNFFPDDIFYRQNEHVFLKTVNSTHQTNKCLLRLHPASIRNNELILPFTDQKNDGFFCFCFSLLNSEITWQRTYFVDHKSRE